MKKELIAELQVKAKDLAAELTRHNVLEKNLRGEEAITTEHVDNNKAIGELLLNRSVKLKELPAEILF